MSDPTTDDSYLDFEEPETIESDESTVSNDIVEEENFSVEDFAILAREANGYNSNSSSDIFDHQVDQFGAQQSEEEKEEDESLSHFDKKINLRRPYLKIIVGIALTSVVLIAMIFFRYSWFKIMNAGRNVENSEQKFSVDPRKQEIDRLKAELAMIEQNKKPIEPEPEPEPEFEPEPEPKPEPEPEPRSQRQPRPEPKPKPIDPYAQWELLSQLGTLGSSADDLDIANLTQERKLTASNAQSEQVTRNSQLPGYLSTINNTDDDPENITKVDNRIASTSLGSIQNPSSQPSNVREDRDVHNAESRFPFSRSSQKIILSGLGVDSNRDKKDNFPQISGSDSRQFATASNVKGILTNSIAWTDGFEPEQTRGSITLAEPLKYSDGSIAFPIGSSIIVEVADFNQAGFVSLDAIAIAIENSQGQIIQQEIPEDSLLIRGKNNQPLKFETENSDSGNSRMNQFFNNAVRSGARNLSLSRGVGSAISRTIRASGSNTANQGEFYFIEPKTPVSIYVNSPISPKP